MQKSLFGSFKSKFLLQPFRELPFYSMYFNQSVLELLKNFRWSFFGILFIIILNSNCLVENLMWEWLHKNSYPFPPVVVLGCGEVRVRKMAYIIIMDGAKELQLIQTKRHLFKMCIPLCLNFLLLDIQQIIIFLGICWNRQV